MKIKYTREKPKPPFVLCQKMADEFIYKRFLVKKLTNHICVDGELNANQVEEYRLNPLGFIGADDDEPMLA